MSEVELDRMLDAVRAAVALAPEDAPPSNFVAPGRAANDNGGIWPLTPFADGAPECGNISTRTFLRGCGEGRRN